MWEGKEGDGKNSEKRLMQAWVSCSGGPDNCLPFFAASGTIHMMSSLMFSSVKLRDG